MNYLNMVSFARESVGQVRDENTVATEMIGREEGGNQAETHYLLRALLTEPKI